MLAVYFDASALVKLVVDEPGSELAATLWDTCAVPVASRLASVEVRSAIAALGRAGTLDDRSLAAANALWEAYAPSIWPVELTAAVEERAGDLARLHGLRGADAVHLASALALDLPDLVVAAWDRRLHAAAAAIGLAVAPASLDA